ncbi:E3 SUMO-protein ligase NSE2-like [Schistocerca americana]|uniref:E3 SUMO-protein ligase NSE2-like n=1 Tax=Schistocerca americana TaxID=7009 RepID=UPI001F4FFB93|nr:E3 SUMO-protein ligase NSE2-like [Schistocerca americana]XP_049957283.1 E3 SUMO-protein ligase NSE2-like [Schistocerca serialis cubense]
MAAYLKEFEEEWQTHKNRFMEYLITLSEPVPVYFQGEERDELLNKMRQMVEDTCELDIRHDEMIRTTKRIESKKKKATTGDSSEVESFKKLYERLLNEEAANRQNPKRHQMYSRLEKTIKDSVDRVSEKDDIVMTDAQINIIDPITMTVLENPVRNRLCNHVYSKKSIQSLLKKPKQLKCPVVGCPIRTTFTMDDLESDHELEEHINKIKSAGGKK